MLKVSLAAAALAGALGLAGAAAAADATGLWATETDHGKVEVGPCSPGSKLLCARIVDADALHTNPDQRDIRNKDTTKRDRKIKGLITMANFSGGPTDWKGGPVYDARDGSAAPTGYWKLVAPDKLKVKGCLGPMLCRGETWTRLR